MSSQENMTAEKQNNTSCLENVVSGNGGVYRWVTLGPPPPHLIEGRPTPANRWGTNNWSIGNTSVFPRSLPMVGGGVTVFNYQGFYDTMST
ncbi:Hypothetical predicted protein [Mytilus galloprovincialis]|uniref:Uncharacterized protein n=1 Tax=Mytilus galloprovincialis TaxID=29158 RepID=A0A8B6DVQ1_MYTGA|nr:Hypothetical predicted protein [Mytilus galloprovincialis]